MKTLINFILFCIVLIFLQNLFWTPPESPKIPNMEGPIPDPNREVYRYDWDHGKYIYKDELLPEKPRKKIPIIARPDQTVQIVDGRGIPIRDDEYRKEKPLGDIIIGDKRYRQQRMANGDIRLILVR